MMRTPRFFSVACRAPNGEIVLFTDAIASTWIGRQKWLKLPFLRGTLAILDSMALGNRCMKIAAEVQVDKQFQPKEGETEQPSLTEEWEPKGPVGKFFKKLFMAIPESARASMGNFAEKHAIAIAVVVGLGVGFLVFNVVPNTLAETLRYRGVKNGMLINYISETVKVVFFIGYLWGISFLEQIRETFKYHGAEHKAINTLEAEQPLTMEHCQAQTRLHPRCGTSFAIIVLIIGFIFMPLIPRYIISQGRQGMFFLDVFARLLIELCMLPIIAGISYELLRLAGKMRNQKWVMMAFKPGLWTQLITTKEPDEKHVEVALAALKEVMKAEEAGRVPEVDSEPHAVPEPA